MFYRVGVSNISGIRLSKIDNYKGAHIDRSYFRDPWRNITYGISIKKVGMAIILKIILR